MRHCGDAEAGESAVPRRAVWSGGARGGRRGYAGLLDRDVVERDALLFASTGDRDAQLVERHLHAALGAVRGRVEVLQESVELRRSGALLVVGRAVARDADVALRGAG